MLGANKHHELYDELRSIVGAKYVSDDLPILLTYTRDMSPFPPGKPQGAVVRPGSVEEVVELVRLANQTRTPLIPMGGKATLSGVPPGQPGRGIILDMKRMDKVIEIDEVNMTATAQAGITLGELQSNANQRGFDIVTAFTPSQSDTVGGQLSGYPGGGFSRYGYSIGTNWHYVLGMKVVLPNGSIVDTGTGKGSISTNRDNTFARGMHGPDFTGMFIADGGMFGIKVEATYRMFSQPKFQKSILRCYDELDEAYPALYELWGIDPSIYVQPYAQGMIMGPELAILVGTEPTWTLFFTCLGNTEEELEFKIKTTEAIFAKHGGRVADPALAHEAEYQMLDSEEMGKLATVGQMPYFNMIISRKDILEACKWGRDYLTHLFREKGIMSDLSDMSRVVTTTWFFPVGTGCALLALVPFYNQNDRELNRIMPELMTEYFEQGSRRGYVVEAAQGYESRLKAKQWTPEYYNYVLNLKKFLDPNNIMNPGIYFM